VSERNPLFYFVIPAFSYSIPFHFPQGVTSQYRVDVGWYVGRLREVPGVFSQGETLEELENNIRDACNFMMEEEEPVLFQAPVPRHAELRNGLCGPIGKHPGIKK